MDTEHIVHDGCAAADGGNNHAPVEALCDVCGHGPAVSHTAGRPDAEYTTLDVEKVVQTVRNLAREYDGALPHSENGADEARRRPEHPWVPGADIS